MTNPSDPGAGQASAWTASQRKAAAAGLRLVLVLLALLAVLAWWFLAERPGPRADLRLRLRPGQGDFVHAEVPLEGEVRRAWTVPAGRTLRVSLRIPGENAVLRLHHAYLRGLPELAVRVVHANGLREEVATLTGSSESWRLDRVPLPVSAGEQVDLEVAVLDGRGKPGLGEALLADLTLESAGRAVRPGERRLKLHHVGADLLAPRALERVAAPATRISDRVDMPGPACLELRDGQTEVFPLEALEHGARLELVTHVHPEAPDDVLAGAELIVRADGELLRSASLTHLARTGPDGQPAHEGLLRVDLSRFGGRDVVIELSLDGGSNLFVGLSEVLVMVPHEAERRLSEERTERHVVLVLADGLRGDRLGALGYARGHTPNLDQLARTGTVWSSVVLPSSWAVPNVASLLTGRSPLMHGVGLASGQRLSPRLPTLAHWASWAGVSTALFSSSSVLGPVTGLHEGFERRAFRRVPAPVLVEAAVDWLYEFEPFDSFLTLHLGDLLPPHKAEPQDLQAVASEIDPELLERLRPLDPRPGLAESMAQEIGPAYDAELARVDRAVGQLVEALTDLGRMQDTLIVLVGTHGQEFFEHGGRGAGQSLFDEVTIVPAIAVGPGIDALRVPVDELISLTDLTLLIGERAGLSSVEGLPGAPPMPYGPGGTERTFHGLLMPVAGRTQRRLEVSRRSGKLLVHDVDLGERHLFDLREDPGALHDLIAERDDIVLTTEAEALAENFEDWFRQELVHRAAWPTDSP